MRKLNYIRNIRIVVLLIFVCINEYMCVAYDNVLQTGPTEPDGYIGGYGYVDLGLPSGTLWAVHNIGAQNEYECGDYFAWGETEPKERYDWDTYSFFLGNMDVSPYRELEDIGWCISGTQYDAANVHWGNGWMMPDSIQLDEIRRHTFDQRVEEFGVNGMRVYSTKKEGKSIFLGDFGAGYDADFPDPKGHYWSGSCMSDPYGTKENTTIAAMNIMTQPYAGMVEWKALGFKQAGFCIRPVINKRNSTVRIETENEFAIYFRDGKIITSRPLVNGSVELLDVTGKVELDMHFDGVCCKLPQKLSGMYIVIVKEFGIKLLVEKIILR